MVEPCRQINNFIPRIVLILNHRDTYLFIGDHLQFMNHWITEKHTCSLEIICNSWITESPRSIVLPVHWRSFAIHESLNHREAYLCVHRRSFAIHESLNHREAYQFIEDHLQFMNHWITEKHTCSSEIICNSCFAFSIPSFGPAIVITSESSFGRGIVMRVAVCNSNFSRFFPFNPRMNRWCSFGMWMIAWDWNEQKIQIDSLHHEDFRSYGRPKWLILILNVFSLMPLPFSMGWNHGTADFPFWSYPTFCVASLRAGPVGCILYNM